jgi:hypothetical protein
MVNKDLSEKIMASVYRVLSQWDKDNPDYPLLNKAQQVNLAAVVLKGLGAQYESDFKSLLKGRTTNELH